jgi:hypothetical protein
MRSAVSPVASLMMNTVFTGRLYHARETRGGPCQNLSVRHLALLAVGCFEVVPAPEPPKPPDPEPVQPCTGEHTQVTGAWSLELLGEIPAIGKNRVVYLRGTKWEVGVVKDVPHSPKNLFDFDNVYDVAVDRDGSVYFRGLWYGNPDQANNVGDGLYRLDGTRAIPLVDPTTPLPGSTQTFNSAGGFSVDGGLLAFWGGRPYQIDGVYAWHDGKVVAIAESTGKVRGTGTPSVRAGRVAFQGEEKGVRGIYLWSDGGAPERIMKSEGPIFGNVALGDHVLYVGGFEPRRVIEWSAGKEWVAARPEWFAGAIGDAPILEPDPVVAGDDLLLQVGQGQRSEVWKVSGCTLERIAGTGDKVGSTTLAGIFDGRMSSPLPDGSIGLRATLADGTHHLLRAHHNDSFQTLAK